MPYICEICDSEITDGIALWGIQVMKGAKPEFHYYCSEEHAKEGEGKLDYKVVGEVVDA
ncbi:hypothetical protein LCGC14_0488830 [marine sediment metagenome]|uniref:Uncharacterized protein n=1 Tax=marine sediment metagenome TaxID=412755 RepID=A0A0F9UU90_9ZZZZ